MYMLKKIMKILFISVLGVSIMAPIQRVHAAEFLDSATHQIAINNPVIVHDKENNAVYTTPQGACSDGRYAYLIFFADKDKTAVIAKYDMNTSSVVQYSEPLELNHGNDMTYDSKNKRLVIVHNAPYKKKISFVDPNTLKIIGNSITLDFDAYSIAYHASTDEYAVGVAGTESTKIVDSNFKEVRSFNQGVSLEGKYVHQGMECDNNYIYYIQSNSSGGYNRLVIYKWDGAFVKTIPVKVLNSNYKSQECENVFFLGNQMYIGYIEGNSLGEQIIRVNLYPGTTYSVKYAANGGLGSMANTTVTYGTSTSLRANTFTKKGYSFKGWYAHRSSDNKWYCKNADNKEKWLRAEDIGNGYSKFLYKDKASVAKTSNVINDTVTFNAQWTSNKYTVKYTSGGGSGTMADTVITYGVGANLRANTFTKKGHAFGGWTAYRKSDGTYRYAKSNSETQQGWYKNGNQPSGYTLYVYKDKAKLSTTTSIPNDIVTLTAKWIANKFTIIYEPNGGSGSMANTSVTYGTSTTLRSNVFKKSGKSFGGWTAYRESDKTWRYALNNSSTQQGWYTEGKQPSGYTKFIYKNGASLATTTSVNNDKVHLYAVWK